MKIYNQAELSTLKLADIADLYNQYASVTGAKPVSKFRDKPTAVKRTLEIQEVAAPFMDVEPEEEVIEAPVVTPEPAVAPEPEVAKPTKAPKKPAKAKAGSSKGNSKTDMTSLVTLVKDRDSNKEGSIGYVLFECMKQAGEKGVTVKQLVEYGIANHHKPRSSEPNTVGYVVTAIRFFVKEGNLSFS